MKVDMPLNKETKANSLMAYQLLMGYLMSDLSVSPTRPDLTQCLFYSSGLRGWGAQAGILACALQDYAGYSSLILKIKTLFDD